jgi:uncharacterized protein (DUF924 family)
LNLHDVLNFWFDEIKPEQQFKKDLGFDALVTERFGALLDKASRCELYAWRETLKGRLGARQFLREPGSAL